MTNGFATYALTDGVAVITMDDGKANALSLDMQNAINSALDQAQSDNATVVLTGRSGILSAGFDLKTLARSGDDAIAMLNGGLSLEWMCYGWPPSLGWQPLRVYGAVDFPPLILAIPCTSAVLPASVPMRRHGVCRPVMHIRGLTMNVS